MIFVFAALYPEAEAFLARFRMKRVEGSGRLQQFASEDGSLILTLTGVGEIAAASAAAAVLSHFSAGPSDGLLSLGSCACLMPEAKLPSDSVPLGQYVRLHSIREKSTGRCFYPDLFEYPEIPECACLTGSRVLNEASEVEACRDGISQVYDMEAAGIYQAANLFLGPEQMIFLRMVTDRGRGDAVSREQLREMCTSRVDIPCRMVDKLLEIAAQREKKRESAPFSEELSVEKLCEDMRLSKTLGDRLRQLLHYMGLADIAIEEEIRGWYESGALPCRDKRAGQKLLKLLEDRI